jgi:hypothetical protein
MAGRPPGKQWAVPRTACALSRPAEGSCMSGAVMRVARKNYGSARVTLTSLSATTSRVARDECHVGKT